MSVLQRNTKLALAAAILSLPWVIWGAVCALDVEANSPTTWVSEDHPVRRNYDEFSAAFEPGDTVIVSWPGCTLDDPRLPKFVDILLRSPSFHDAQGMPYIDSVQTGRELLEELTSPPLNLPRDEALSRLLGTLIGPDGLSTMAVINLTQVGGDQRERTVPLIRGALSDLCDVPLEDQRMAGPMIDGLSVDLASSDTLNQLGGISAAVIFLLCWICLKSWKASATVFALAFYCQALTLAVLHFTGGVLSALLIVMPPLILVLGVSSGIHMVHYFYEVRHGTDGEQAARQALGLGWLPCSLSSGTTAIGLLSLAISHLSPIRLFGIYASIGVVVSLLCLLSLIPGAFIWWSRNEPPGPDLEDELPPDPVWIAWWFPLSRYVIRYHNLIAFVSLAFMIFCGWGVQYLKTSVRIQTLFPADSRILQDYAWLEKQIGPLAPVEIVIRIPHKSSLTLLNRLDFVEQVQAELLSIDGVSGVISAATFSPSSDQEGGITASMGRALFARRLRENLPHFQESRFLNVTPTDQLWRITARLGALDDVDYGYFLNTVQQRVEPMLQNVNRGHNLPITAVYTGVMPVVHEIQRELFHDLFASFMCAFVMIGGVMIVVQRGVMAGMVSMVSNIFPMVLMFGILGWLQVRIDIGSVMTASVALGIAVDDTLHYLTFFRRGLQHGYEPRQAVRYAYQHCATAMLQTSLILGLGLMVFSASSFLPTSRFAWMMLFLLTMALVGDLVVLPAMLSGRVGRLFQTRI